MPATPPGGQQVPRSGDTVGGYCLRQLLHQAEGSSTFAAIHPVSGRKVALRIIDRALLADGEVTRLRADIERLGGTADDGIVRVLSVGDLSRGRFFIVSEFASGRTLGELLRTTPRLPVAEAAALVDALAAVLERAHRRGVVHGGLEPGKIFVFRTDDGQWPPRLKVAGFASWLRADRSAHACRAPEQRRGVSPDARSDIFALGAIAQLMVSGGAAASGEQAPPPATDWIARALAPDPEARYQNVAELRTALRAVIQASRPSSGVSAPSPVSAVAADRTAGTPADAGDGAERTEPAAVAEVPVASTEPAALTSFAAPVNRRRRGRLWPWALLWLAIAGGVGGALYRLVSGGWSTAPAEVRGGRGLLEVITAPPGAQLRVDRAPWPQRTPTTVPVIRGRPYEVFVHRKGYLPVRQRVALGIAEPRRKLTVRLARKPRGWGTLQLTTNVRVDVMLDARRVGTAVNELTLADVRAGVDHRLRLSAPGHRTVQQTVRVEAGKVRVLKFELRPVDTSAVGK